jgi:hypothetical protein
MMVIRDFRCPNGHQTEQFVDNLQEYIPCQECDLKATRLLTACNFALEGTSGDFPTSAQKWTKRHTA